jgi:Ca2+-binding RTX toxin-like protein
LRGGDDTFAGGPGNDIYVLDSIRDVVKEESFEGVDTVFVGFNYSIANTAIENVKTFSNQTSALTFTGNSWTNVLEGGSGDDSLYGGEGSDTLKGGLGNDLIDGGLDTDYAVFSSAFSELSFKASGPDIIVTSKGEGTDTLRNMEFINAGGTVYNLSNILTSTLPTYKLTTVDSTVNEGSTATFTVSTTNVASGTSLAYALLGVSASDITGGSLTGTTTVGANGQATISIPLAADQTTEGDETLTVTVQGQSASTTIKDTSLTPTIQFSISSGSAAEGNSGNSTITVQAALSIASTKTVTVPVTYSGTATQGTDYTNATSSITIAAGQTTGSATFSILGDTNVEPNETVILTMGTPTIATLGTNKVYTHSIVNEDEIFFAPLLNSNNGHYYQLVQSNVDWFSALAGSASQSYRGLGGYLLVIDDLSESNFVKVLPGLSGPNYAYWLGINDADKEGFWVIKAGPDLGQNAKFFDWVAGEPNNYGSQENFAHIWGDDRQKWNDLDVTGSPFFSMGYIVEYGGLPVTYTITPLVASVIEGSSVTFTIDTKNVEWGTNISYTLTGISQSDLASGSLTGTTVVSQQGVDGRATVTVALAADSLLETPESLRLTVGSTTSAPVTVLDLPRVPLPTVQFTTTAGSANEGNTGSTTVTVQATLSAASTQTVTIPISYSGTASPGTDYTNAATSITIAAGQTTGSATFSVIGDTTFESNETVILTLGTPTNATLGANTSYTHTITNDDVALSTYAISAGATSYNEGTSASFTVTTTNVAANTSLNFTITGLNAADVTGGSLSGTTTVGANGQATISVPLAADQTTEGDETLTVTVQGQTASTRIVDLSRNYPLMLGDDANNSLVGGGAGDYIFGGKGNDTLEGGEGVDTAVMGGDLSRYRVSVTSQGVEVADKVTGEIDTLKNMERIEFGDKVLNLTIQRSQALVSTADANRIAELYVAFFNRVPEADGLEYWIKERAKGMSIEAISNNFYAVGASNDYAALTGFRADMGDQDFINLFYRNVLGRSEGADPGGLAYWQGKLSRGEVTRGKLAEQIISAAYEYRADPTLSGVVQLLENKVSVARKVAMEWGLNYNADGATAYAQSQQVAKAISADSTESALALIGVTSADLSLG